MAASRISVLQQFHRWVNWRCGNSAVGSPATTWRGPQHWRHTTTVRTRRCVCDPLVHGFAVSGQRTVSVAAVVLLGRVTTCCCTRCHFTVVGPKGSLRFSGYGYFAHGFAGSPRPWPKRCTTSGPPSTIWSTPGGPDRADGYLARRFHASALLASVDDRIQAVIPNVQSSPRIARSTSAVPVNKLVALERLAARPIRELSAAATAYASPLNYRPLVPKDRRSHHHRIG